MVDSMFSADTPEQKKKRKTWRRIEARTSDNADEIQRTIGSPQTDQTGAQRPEGTLMRSDPSRGALW